MFLLRVRGAFFFWLWVRPCPGLGRSGGIQLGVGRPALLRVRGAFFFAAGARQVHSLTCCRPPPRIHCRKASRVRGAFIFLLRVRELWGSAFIFFAAGACGCAALLFFLLWVRGKFTHSLAAGRLQTSTAERHPGSAARLFLFLRVCELWGGGARLFFCCGCAALFLLAVGARQVHSLTRCPPPGEHQQQKSTHNKKKKSRVPGTYILSSKTRTDLT